VPEKITITVDDVSATAVLRRETAPLTAAALRSVLPFSSVVRQAMWSGHAATIRLPDDFILPAPETPVSLVDVGVLAIAERGGDLLVAYGPCVAMDATGPLRATRVAHLTDGRGQFLERLARLAAEGSAAARVE
jgi:hypothetical protein